MSLVINTNIASMIAADNLAKAEQQLQKSQQQLFQWFGRLSARPTTRAAWRCR